ncbi:MAG: UDP-N-acetylmuramate dehydrogenase [Alphaproteobacteria bacterium]|nr:UDP-N-acetylmuramate dehydrogenase [Alphaproteobacteria bacterium]
MAARPTVVRLLDRLPPVRGTYVESAPLSGITWFRAGGPAEILFLPADADDLAEFVAGKPADVPVTLLGAGSNVLIRDGGVPGVVIRFGKPFARMSVDGLTVTAGGMALDYNVAKVCRDAAIAGFEFLSGIPGTIGGGLRMNAGAYGRDLADVVVDVGVVTDTGKQRRLTREEWGPTYRHAAVPESWIFIDATMQGVRGDAVEIARAMAWVQAARDEAQPIRSRTGGSTFKNPAGARAWELIDRAGCRGLRRGAAQVSEKHCNFLINNGGATATDLEALGEEVRRRVAEACGVTLEWEIRRLGVPTAAGLREVAP